MFLYYLQIRKPGLLSQYRTGADELINLYNKIVLWTRDGARVRECRECWRRAIAIDLLRRRSGILIQSFLITTHENCL